MSKYHRHNESCVGKRTKLYAVWLGINNRCTNPNQKNYYLYGGRGIKVCKEWRSNSSKFLVWARSNGYKEGLVIDRINNNGNYCPKNCRFITQSQNNINKRKRKDFGIYKTKYSYHIRLKRNTKIYWGGATKDIKTARQLRDILFNKLNNQ